MGVPEVGWEDMVGGTEGCEDIDGCPVGFGEIVGAIVGGDEGDNVGLLDIVGDEVGVPIGLSVGEMLVGDVVGDVVAIALTGDIVAFRAMAAGTLWDTNSVIKNIIFSIILPFL